MIRQCSLSAKAAGDFQKTERKITKFGQIIASLTSLVNIDAVGLPVCSLAPPQLPPHFPQGGLGAVALDKARSESRQRLQNSLVCEVLVGNKNVVTSR